MSRNLAWTRYVTVNTGTRVADPDSIGSVDPDSESGSGFRRAKMIAKVEKLGNFMF
jgi:hypothetical protein